jgi:glycosyltransferase involved in cell wall biosynthesis
MMRLAVFNTHPIQHFAPWWQELARDPRLRLKVFYYSRANVQTHYDPEFGIHLAYDVDLLSGYDHAFLPRPWPFRDSTSVEWYALNHGIRAALSEDRWDAVLVFGYNLLNNWTVLREARRLHIPVIFFSDSNVRTAHAKPTWKLALKRLWVRTFFRGVDTFLTPGNSNMDYLHLYGVGRERMRLCPLPVDVKRFRSEAGILGTESRAELRKRFRLEADDFVVTFSGKLVERKRPQDLADAVRTLGDPGVKALFVGCGPLEEELRRRSGEFVRLTGFVNQLEIPRILALGDLGVMPSGYDPHPLAVTESLALGVPVLVSDLIGCHGPDDALRNGENGYVYPCGDIAALAELIGRLKNDRELLARLQERARELIHSQTPQAAKEAVLDCLERLKEPTKKSQLDHGLHGKHG